MNIVGIGGGTGLPVVLRGLRHLSEHGASGPLGISAVVCVSDNGGSSGSLHRYFGLPAVGDLRNCLVALSDSEGLLADLFQHRFAEGNGLQGHSLGNLIVTALYQKTGSLAAAIGLAKEILDSRGRVFPVTESSVTLCAELESGQHIYGESQIAAARSRITRLWLDPSDVHPAPGVLEALGAADAIILGPGSLYSSIIPNLLVAGVAEAIRNSPALKIFICNLVTQPGETQAFSAADHLRALQGYMGGHAIDVCVLNSQPLEPAVREAYREFGSEPVSWSEEEIEQLGVMPAVADLLDGQQRKIRHDAIRLARTIVSALATMSREERAFPMHQSLVTPEVAVCAELSGI